jgi:hypothetical protein
VEELMESEGTVGGLPELVTYREVAGEAKSFFTDVVEKFGSTGDKLFPNGIEVILIKVKVGNSFDITFAFGGKDSNIKSELAAVDRQEADRSALETNSILDSGLVQ